MIVERIFCFLGTNEIVLGIASICGIVGFILTVIVSIRTANISKVLRYNSITSQYNKERKAFQQTFEGHRKSILEDDLRSEKLLKDILRDVEEYRIKFHELLSFREKFTMILFVHLLKKEARKVNYNWVCNYLAIISGRLSKREEKRNG